MSFAIKSKLLSRAQQVSLHAFFLWFDHKSANLAFLHSLVHQPTTKPTEVHPPIEETTIKQFDCLKLFVRLK